MNNEAKELAQRIAGKHDKKTLPQFLKFKSSMRTLFNDPNMFNRQLKKPYQCSIKGELSTQKKRLTDESWSK
tara:strand:+ start:404 stop:619 length:216 start_codon:yes stop_codon:yes gene_type:complete